MSLVTVIPAVSSVGRLGRSSTKLGNVSGSDAAHSGSVTPDSWQNKSQSVAVTFKLNLSVEMPDVTVHCNGRPVDSIRLQDKRILQFIVKHHNGDVAKVQQELDGFKINLSELTDVHTGEKSYSFSMDVRVRGGGKVGPDTFSDMLKGHPVDDTRLQQSVNREWNRATLLHIASARGDAKSAGSLIGFGANVYHEYYPTQSSVVSYTLEGAWKSPPESRLVFPGNLMSHVHGKNGAYLQYKFLNRADSTPFDGMRQQWDKDQIAFNQSALVTSGVFTPDDFSLNPFKVAIKHGHGAALFETFRGAGLFDITQPIKGIGVPYNPPILFRILCCCCMPSKVGVADMPKIGPNRPSYVAEYLPLAIDGNHVAVIDQLLSVEQPALKSQTRQVGYLYALYGQKLKSALHLLTGASNTESKSDVSDMSLPALKSPEEAFLMNILPLVDQARTLVQSVQSLRYERAAANADDSDDDSGDNPYLSPGEMFDQLQMSVQQWLEQGMVNTAKNTGCYGTPLFAAVDQIASALISLDDGSDVANLLTNVLSAGNVGSQIDLTQFRVKPDTDASAMAKLVLMVALLVQTDARMAQETVENYRTVLQEVIESELMPVLEKGSGSMSAKLQQAHDSVVEPLFQKYKPGKDASVTVPLNAGGRAPLVVTPLTYCFYPQQHLYDPSQLERVVVEEPRVVENKLMMINHILDSGYTVDLQEIKQGVADYASRIGSSVETLATKAREKGLTTLAKTLT